MTASEETRVSANLWDPCSDECVDACNDERGLAGSVFADAEVDRAANPK